MSPILAAKAWKDNGELIADAFTLHVKNIDTALVVDSTFGEGTFWNALRPPNFHPFDLNKSVLISEEWPFQVRKADWGDLPFADNTVDVVVFDPPYVSRGGRSTSTIPGMVDDYGMDDAAHSPEALWTDIERGVDEAARILKPKGLLMFKVMPYISSGHLQNTLMWTMEAFNANRLELWDWFVFVGKPGPQPKHDKCKVCIDGTVSIFDSGSGAYLDEQCPTCKGLRGKPRRQVHARNNASHLMVARKRPAPRARK